MKPTSPCGRAVSATRAGEVALEISRGVGCLLYPAGHEDRFTVDDFRSCIDGKSSGAVRISVGMVTNFNDIQGFWPSPGDF